MKITDTLSEPFIYDLTDPASKSDLVCESEHYKPIILEYCLLALRESLTEVEQDRMGEIYDMATEDPILSFWLEEGDHLVAHHLGLVDETFIKQQQDNFRRSIGQSWIDNLWQDLQSTTKVLQVYLQRRGFYHGSIDGIVGPYTQQAMHQLQKQSGPLTESGSTRGNNPLQ
ncbi:MAG: peptidoglycan-binding domain-containing protein [Cyanobacteria bacterium J06639_14]